MTVHSQKKSFKKL